MTTIKPRKLSSSLRGSLSDRKGTTKINIPKTIIDKHYRYKREIISIRSEGRGKNTHTILLNINSISKSLDRHVSVIGKYFSFRLGVRYVISKEKNTLSSICKVDELEILLENFIEQYVLCMSCNNPETSFELSGMVLFLSCKACGNLTKCNQKNKLTDYITKVTHNSKTIKTKKYDMIDTKSKFLTNQDEEFTFSLKMDEENVRKRREMEVGNNPLFFSLISQVGEIIAGLDVNNINKRIITLKDINNHRLLLYVLENEYNVYHSNISPLIILKKLYDEEIIEEDDILDWYRSRSRKISSEVSKNIRKDVQPMIKWLTEAEEESE